MTTLRSRLLTRTAAPATEPLTLAETKVYLRVDHNSDDSLISDLIVAGRLAAEAWLKTSLITQTWKLAFDDYADDVIALPMGPVLSIGAVTIIGRDGSSQVVSSATYYLNAAKDTLLMDSPVFGFRVEITYVAGFGDASAVPKLIKQGMLRHIAEMYDNRGEEPNAALPDQAVRLYMPFREVRL